MWQVSWTYPDELKTLQSQQLILETIRMVETNGFFYPGYSTMKSQLDVNETTMQKSNSEGRWSFAVNVPRSSIFFDKVMAVDASSRIVITAIALKRYQLKHRKYPTNLNSLIPEFISSLPADPVDGKPLRYRRNKDDTYLLYSIGFNGKDDDGDPSNLRTHTGYDNWLDFDDRDWVWPEPATDAEIQNFYTQQEMFLRAMRR